MAKAHNELPRAALLALRALGFLFVVTPDDTYVIYVENGNSNSIYASGKNANEACERAFEQCRTLVANHG